MNVLIFCLGYAQTRSSNERQKKQTKQKPNQAGLFFFPPNPGLEESRGGLGLKNITFWPWFSAVHVETETPQLDSGF